MAKRPKYVYSSSYEVFHLWANQTQDHARQASSSGGMHGFRGCRAFFDGKSCYSYGRHYEVGRLVEINGYKVALINRTGYSHTTSKHINEASSAASHLLQIDVDSSFDWKKGLIEMQSNLIDGLFDILKRRKFYSDFSEWGWDTYRKNSFENFNKLCDALKMKHLKIWPDNETLQVLKDHVKECRERQKELEAYKQTPEYTEKQAARAEKKRLEYEAKHKAEIDAWKNGGSFTSAVTQCNPPLIRIHNNEVETSRHARIPLSDARRALMDLLNGRIKAGYKIGDFTVIKNIGDTLQIGCHTLSKAMIESVMKEYITKG